MKLISNGVSKKLLVLVIGAVLVFPFISFAGLAASVPPGAPTVNIAATIGKIVGVVWMVMMALAIIMFAWAGLTFLLAAGSPEKIKQAKTMALWGVIGVVVMLLAFSIFNIVSNLF